jgi:sporulation protein YlmC with PRC-barrel domain
MRIRLDAKVRTKDGHRAGRVKKILWDPKANEISAFVVGTGGLLGHDVLISREVLDRATPDGEEVVVELTKDELGQLEHYEEDSYVTPPLGWPAPVMYDYPSAAYILAATPDPLARAAGARHDLHEHGKPQFTKGMRVRDATGAEVGVVDEIRIEESTGEVRALVVRDGDSTREIATDHVDVGDGEVHVIEESSPKSGRGTAWT